MSNIIKPVKVQIPFSGFYETIHDARITDAVNNLFEDEHGELSEENADAIWASDIDWTDLQNNYCKEYVRSFSDRYELTMEFDEMTSPREYNFSTDRLFVLMPFDQVKRIREEVFADRDWQTKVDEVYSDRDGFWSFYPTDLTDEKWTREILDECQYETILEHWLEMKYRDDPNNNQDGYGVDMELADDIYVYELDGLNGAYEAVEEYKATLTSS